MKGCPLFALLSGKRLKQDALSKCRRWPDGFEPGRANEALLAGLAAAAAAATQMDSNEPPCTAHAMLFIATNIR